MTRFILATALCLTTFLSACDTGEPIGPEADAEPLFAARGSSRSVGPVLSFATEEKVGMSKLTRTYHGASFQVRTTGLPAGTAATVWMLFFNQPENCATNPCGEPDLFDPEVMADVVYGAGHVVGHAGGTVTFAGHAHTGDATRSIFAPLGLPAPGLMDSKTAEIHLIVRSHGPAIPALLPDMIQTFNGGCQNPGPPFPDHLPPELGVPGPNTCVDVQFAVHHP